MVSTLDGAARGANERSGSISTAADREVFALMRGLADVVFVGAGTVRKERYGPVDLIAEHAQRRRHNGQPRTAPIAVVSRSLTFDPSAPLFAKAEQRTIVFTSESSPQERRNALSEVADVVIAGDESVDVTTALDELDRRGLRQVLCEGGPTLLAQVVHADLLDELCLTLTPALAAGPALRILDGPLLPSGTDTWDLGHIIEDDSALLTRWTRRRPT